LHAGADEPRARPVPRRRAWLRDARRRQPAPPRPAGQGGAPRARRDRLYNADPRAVGRVRAGDCRRDGQARLLMPLLIVLAIRISIRVKLALEATFNLLRDAEVRRALPWRYIKTLPRRNGWIAIVTASLMIAVVAVLVALV